MLVLLLACTSSGPATTADTGATATACADAPTLPVPECATFAPVCAPGAITLAADDAVWQVDGPYLRLTNVAPRFEVLLRFHEDVEALAPEELEAQLRTVDLAFDVEIGSASGAFVDGILEDPAVDRFEATDDRLRIAIRSDHFLATSEEYVSPDPYVDGCSEDDITWCNCRFEVPSAVVVEVDAPFGG